MGYDEPETLSYSIDPICLKGADVRHLGIFAGWTKEEFNSEFDLYRSIDLDANSLVGWTFQDGDLIGHMFTLDVIAPRISPVPLPAAFPLFGTGLGILGFLGWRRRRKLAQAV